MLQTEAFNQDSVSGFLHRPSESNNQGVVLTHGAGGNCQTPLLVAVANAFALAGVYVLLFDLPFRMRRPFGPPHRPQAEEDRAGLRRAVRLMRGIVSGPVTLGGHSYGGRQASMLAAEDDSVCDALMLLSYPLHPPKKPDQLRTAHFPQVKTRSLFVHGTKDPFGTVEEMRTALQLMRGTCEISIVENAGHDLKGGKIDIASRVVGPVQKLTKEVPAR